MEYTKSCINYIGCKHKLLQSILPLFPKDINTFVDLCTGSGTVSLNVKASKYILNDINYKIIGILKGIRTENVNEVLKTIKGYINTYDLSKTNLEGFQKLRETYNSNEENWKMLYTLMCYSFNYQYRFNNFGKYNSSFGKNRSQFSKNQENNLIECSQILKNMNCKFSCDDIGEFDYSKLTYGDFVYIDPPYYNSTGNYNDGKRLFGDWKQVNEFTLYSVMKMLNSRNVKFAVSNNLTVNPQIGEFAEKQGFTIHHLYADYSNCNYQKKDKTSKDDEVLITNY